MTLGLLLDFRKAFDTVQCHILLQKLERSGVRGVALRLLADYLTDRHRFIQLHEPDSKTLEIKHIVPEAPNSRPLLFLIYINEVTNTFECAEIVRYADNTNVFGACASQEALDGRANTYLTYCIR